jgi:hypothetical protein
MPRPALHGPKYPRRAVTVPFRFFSRTSIVCQPGHATPVGT